MFQLGTDGGGLLGACHCLPGFAPVSRFFAEQLSALSNTDEYLCRVELDTAAHEAIFWRLELYALF